MSNVLTDEEIMAIRNKCSHDNGVIISMDFAREIERAVLAKAGEQEPVGWEITDGEGGCFYSNDEPSQSDIEHAERYGRKYYPRYAHPAPQQAIPEVTPEMLRAAQLHSELGAFACSNWSGGYDCITELFNVMLSASPKV